MRDWLTPPEIVRLALPGLPTTVRGVNRIAAEQGWAAAKDAAGEPLARPRKGQRGGGLEYHYTVLPSSAQWRLTAALNGPAPAPAEEPAAEDSSDFDDIEGGAGYVDDTAERAEAWRRYELLPGKAKTRAEALLATLDAVEILKRGGMTTSAAVAIVARQRKASTTSIYEWYGRVRGVARPDWLPYLAPRYVGRTVTAEMDPALWEYLKADYLRLAGRPFAVCYETVQRMAVKRGLALPSMKTLQRRMDAEVSPEVQCLARKGVDELKRTYPAQRRDRSVFHSLEAVNGDGHKFDVFVRWHDGSVGRPVMVAIQDLRSGMILGWRVGQSECAELVRLVIGDVIERYGIFEHIYLDNGRSFASKWLTGRMAHRYRFKIRPDEPAGILKNLGVEVHWTTPYAGQSKPIERAFRDLCDLVAKHPRFDGAYTGNSPMAKPEDYGSRAIPIDDFVDTVEQEIRWHNDKPGRRSAVCGGTKSFRQAFEESYVVAPIVKAAPEQRRLWLLAAEGVSAGSVDGVINLMGNRYWSPEVGRLAGQRLIVRFDPQRLHQDLHVYQLDNRYVGAARCIEDVGFADTDAARSHARDRRQYMRATREALDAERRLTAADVAAAIPRIEAEEPPAARLVRPVFSPPAAAAALPAEPDDDLLADDDLTGRIFDLQARMERRRA